MRSLVGLWMALSPGVRKLGEKAGIEVERKFAPPSDAEAFKERVRAVGGEVLGEVRFEDTYYDTEDCLLARRDEWLRRRDEAWEFKVPAGEGRSGGERTSFREVEGAVDVETELRARHPERVGGDGPENLAELLQASGFVPFARFGTERAKFRLEDCALDLDVASFGHGVLEIEVMVATPDDIPDAERRIERVADLVGAQPHSEQTGGKLETYIRRHAPPRVLAALVQVGIFDS